MSERLENKQDGESLTGWNTKGALSKSSSFNFPDNISIEGFDKAKRTYT